MKADLTRWTFEAAKHYRTVRMQQGRVQLDADWNEQQDITHHRVETESIDVIGEGAVPVGGDFEVTDNGGDLAIAAGRAYVHGMLCENDALTSVTTQPDWPPNASPILPTGATLTPMPPSGSVAQNHIVVYDNAGLAQNPADGIYLAYLEVWQRHLTLLEDPLIHEVALGDPDTATREKTVWQVKLMNAGKLGDGVTCESAVSSWTTLTTPPDGTLAARSEPTQPPVDDCMLSPDAGFRSLSNLLYRVEIHDDGSLSKLRYKWSHDNGSIATKVVNWLGNPVADEFEVASIGRDDTLAIVAGSWVEFYDDVHELLGQPGTLVPVLKTAGNIVTVDLTKAIGSLDPALFKANPRVRRWDGVVDAITAPSGSSSGWTPLESGVEVKLTPGKYRIGDYWLIPARVTSADVEWPKVGGAPAFLPPRGILRAFMRLGVFQVAGGTWKRLWDCRAQFPALSELTQLVYIGGDGQEVPPNPLAPAPIPLPSPLSVGVFNGEYPIVGADVKFTVSNGDLGGALTQTVKSGNDGVAIAHWRLAPDAIDQTATAELLLAGAPVMGRYAKICFSARLSTAAQVSYDPASAPSLKAGGIHDVQKAIDDLANRDAYDIPDPLPACTDGTGSGSKTLRELLNVPAGPTVGSLMELLFCQMRATHLPIDRSTIKCAAIQTDATVVTVQDAINKLCQEVSRGCEVSVAPGELEAVLLAFAAAPDKTLTLCLLPGAHAISKPIGIRGKSALVIKGLSTASGVTLAVTQTWQATRMAFSNVFFTLGRDAELTLDGGDGHGDISASHCRFQRTDPSASTFQPVLQLAGSGVNLEIRNCTFSAATAAATGLRGIALALAPSELGGVLSDNVFENGDVVQMNDLPLGDSGKAVDAGVSVKHISVSGDLVTSRALAKSLALTNNRFQKFWALVPPTNVDGTLTQTVFGVHKCLMAGNYFTQPLNSIVCGDLSCQGNAFYTFGSDFDFALWLVSRATLTGNLGDSHNGKIGIKVASSITACFQQAANFFPVAVR